MRGLTALGEQVSQRFLSVIQDPIKAVFVKIESHQLGYDRLMSRGEWQEIEDVEIAKNDFSGYPILHHFMPLQFSSTNRSKANGDLVCPYDGSCIEALVVVCSYVYLAVSLDREKFDRSPNNAETLFASRESRGG